MSPQMNGEPRDEAASSLSNATPSLPVLDEVARSLPPALITDRVSKTVMTEDRSLAPLFAAEATEGFRTRWDMVQKGFVDDPRKAVHDADELVAQVTQSLTESFANQRADLEKRFDRAQEPTTENLRIALRQYRSFFERLLSI